MNRVCYIPQNKNLDVRKSTDDNFLVFFYRKFYVWPTNRVCIIQSTHHMQGMRFVYSYVHNIFP